MQSAIGPEKLDPYQQLAISLQKNGNDYTLEFTLVYDSVAIADSNVATLQNRLSEGSSITGKRVSELWTVQNVKAVGPLLKATVKLIPQASGKTINVLGLITNMDYWYLYPN